MRQFPDATGHVWRIEINISSVRRVRDLLDIDMCAIAMTPDGYATICQVVADPIALVDIIHLCLSEPVDADEFAKAMVGDAIAAAREAFFEDLINFFPSPNRPMVRGMIETANAAMIMMIPEIQPEKIRELIQSMCGELSTASQDAQGSILSD